MRVPLRHVVDNLVWTVHGTVWAVYEVTPVASRFVPARTRKELVGRLTSMVRQLSGSPRWFGLCAQVDEGEVVVRMVEGVDLNARPAWDEVANACLSLLDGQEMFRRTHWLAIPLRPPTAWAEAQAAAAAAWSEVGDLLGLAPARVSGGEVDAYRRRAQHLAAQLAGGPALRPAKAAEIVWMLEHAVHRGLDEPLLARAQSATTGGGRLVGDTLHSPSYQGLGQVRITEGGQLGAGGRTDQGQSRAWWKRGDGTSPVLRRWLEVESEQGCSYQAHLAIGQQPAAVTAAGC